MPGDLLDLILLLLAAAFAVAGYRQGFIIGMFSFAGFIGGAAIGAFVGPGIAAALTSTQNPQAFVAILAVFGSAVSGMLLASWLGVRLRSHVRGPATVVDAVGGAAVNVIAMLLLAWLVGSFVAYAPFPAIARQVNDSIVLRSVDSLIPASARPEFSALRRMLTAGQYTQVFGALGAETALDVPAPDPRVLTSRGLRLARNSVVKIEGVATTCSRKIEGSGFVIAPGLVVTNAHVVAGVTDGPAIFTRWNSEFPARVVLFDPRRDVALLDVPGLGVRPLALARTPAPFGGDAIVAGYPLNEPFTAVAARAGRPELAAGPDIYQTVQVARQIYPIKAAVKPGNSGGPLLSPSGSVYGMVFAAAISVPGTGYALTAAEIAPDISRGELSHTSVGTGSCQ